MSLWARITPPFLSNLGGSGAYNLGAWLLYEGAPPPFDHHGTLYADTETYGLSADMQRAIISATLYGAFKTADAGQYRGGEAGAALWFTLSSEEGMQLGGELLARFGQHAGVPGQAQLVGFLGIRFFNEWGATVAAAHARTLAGTDGPWSGFAVLGNSIGPAYKVPARAESSLLRELLSLIRPSRPQLSPLAAWRPAGTSSCIMDPRRPCVAGYGLGILPLQVGPLIPEMEPAREEVAEQREETGPTAGRASPVSSGSGPRPFDRRGRGT